VAGLAQAWNEISSKAVASSGVNFDKIKPLCEDGS